MSAYRAKSVCVLGYIQFESGSRGLVLRSSAVFLIVGLRQCDLGGFSITKIVGKLPVVVKPGIQCPSRRRPPARKIRVYSDGEDGRLPASAQQFGHKRSTPDVLHRL